MKRVATIFSVLLASCLAKAQSDIDALRYSRLDFGGTARFNAMGGAFGALGGDFSSLSTNPAGIAIFRKSEISFSPSFYNANTNSIFNGSSSADGKANFNFGNAGLVLAGHNDENDQSDWRGFAFGVGYNRMANFHNRISVEGVNNRSSMIDLWLGEANSLGTDTDSFDQFGTALAYSTGLIRRPSSSSPNYYSIIPNYGETQTKTVESSGAIGETVISLGGNYRDKLYIGGTFGFPRIHYDETTSHTETVTNDTTYYLDHFTYSSSLTTRGSGFNFKFGMIMKPVEWLRIGAAFHSPSYFRLTDQYSNSMTVVYNYSGGTYTSDSPSGSYDYNLTTPMRAIGSLAFIYKNLGLISVDYEYVDYSTASFHAVDYPFSYENKAIRNKYTATGNIRTGLEVKLSPFSLRAGYAYYGSPYRTGVNAGGSKQSICFGLGYRGEGFYVDAAFVHSMMSEDYYLYDPTIIDAAHNSFSANTIMFTLGIKY